MGKALPLPRPDGRRHRLAAAAGREARRLRRRHHLRDQQRVRLRLPARQHGLRRRVADAAQAVLRDRRRGRLDPDRRGAHAADHQRPGRGPCRALRQDERGRADAAADGARAEVGCSRMRPATTGSTRRRTRCTCRKPGHEHAEEILGRHGAAAGRREPLRPGQHRADPPPDGGAARAHAVPPGPALRGAGRRGRHRRRVHRPADGRAGAGPTACTRASRRRKACRSRPRTRRSRRSPSRTTSACTRSWPA